MVNGTDMECASGTTIGSTNISVSVDPLATTRPLNLTSALQTLQTNHTVVVDNCYTVSCANVSTYWNISIPSGATGDCKGNATFVAEEDS